MRIANSTNVAGYARRFAHGHRSLFGLASDEQWYGIHTYKPNGERDRVPEDMTINFSESGHPVFHGSSAFERGALKRKVKKQNCLYILVVTKIQPKWFFAQSFPSISSVSTEQKWICAPNWLGKSLDVQKVHGNLLLRTIRRPW